MSLDFGHDWASATVDSGAAVSCLPSEIAYDQNMKVLAEQTAMNYRDASGRSAPACSWFRESPCESWRSGKWH